MRLAAIVIQKVGFDNEFIAIYVVFCVMIWLFFGKLI